MKAFCFHDWGQWTPPHEDKFGGEGKLLQARMCQKCSKTVIARVKQPPWSRSDLSTVLSRLAMMKESNDDSE